MGLVVRESAVAVVREGADSVRRLHLSMDDMEARDPHLAVVHRLWSSRRSAGRLPSRRSMDPLEMRPALGRIHIVETESEDPLGYWYRLWGSLVSLDGGRNYTNTFVAECEPKVYRDAVAADYATVVRTGEPSYQEVEAVLNFLTYQYARLILPLAENGRTVTNLLVCVHERPLAALGRS